MKTKELTNVPGLKPEEKVIIKRLNYGEKQDLADKSATVSVVNGREKVGISLGKTKMWIVLYSILEASFFKGALNEEQKYNVIRSLEQETGDFLFAEVHKLNGTELDEELKKK